MHKTKEVSYNLEVRMLVTTPELQSILGCGRVSAVKIGERAKARVEIGRRVLWNTTKLQDYLNEIAV